MVKLINYQFELIKNHLQTGYKHELITKLTLQTNQKTISIADLTTIADVATINKIFTEFKTQDYITILDFETLKTNKITFTTIYQQLANKDQDQQRTLIHNLIYDYTNTPNNYEREFTHGKIIY